MVGMETERNLESKPVTWESLQAQLVSFSHRLTSAYDILGVRDRLQELDIDHVCIRLDTKAKVENLLIEISDRGEIISETVVNGRTIYIFKLSTPIEIAGKSVSCLEIPEPKAGHDYPRWLGARGIYSA